MYAMTLPAMPLPRPRLRTILFCLGGAAAIAAFSLTILAAVSGFFDTNPVHLFGLDGGKPKRFVTAYFSGDMGLRVGMGTYVAPALAAKGIPVYGMASPAVFGRQRDQAFVNAYVAEVTRQALAKSGADQVILMGQSFGSDILASGLAALPADLRAKVAGVVLVVPASTAYFRADPTGLRYYGTPDADTVALVKQASWAPITCIYGQSETDSLCPALLGSNARVVELPGGHFLDNDHHKLVSTIFTALGPVIDPPKEDNK
jgi:type IV secretory pathway VirJ component